MIKKGVAFIIMVLMSSIFLPQFALAKESHTFEVAIASQLSHNNKIKSYYDITVKPGEKLKLPFQIKNTGSEASTFELSFNSALTGSTGSISYAGKEQSKLIAGALDITQYARLSASKITVDPGESKEVNLQVEMPEKTFKGKIAGGLRVAQLPNDDVKGSVQHTFAREIAVVLQNEVKEIVPEIEFYKASVARNTRRKYLIVEMANVAPAYLSRGQIEYEVKKGNDSILTGEKLLRISPSTAFSYHIPLTDTKFDTGDYTIDLTVKAGEDTWQDTLSFTINPADSKIINETNDVEKSFPIVTVLLAGVIAILTLIILVLILKRKKEK